jgi:hypothetical protein
MGFPLLVGSSRTRSHAIRLTARATVSQTLFEMMFVISTQTSDAQIARPSTLEILRCAIAHHTLRRIASE